MGDSDTTPKQLGAVCHDNGVAFRVWAPFADSVGVIGTFNNWQAAPMVKEDNGVWFADIADAKPGQEYKYLIKNGDRELRRNDPRALHVITTHGNSVIVKTDYDWEGDNFEPAPIEKQVIYEMHVGTFNRGDTDEPGSFATAAEKLDHLASLGVTMIELMPICNMDNDSGWGYTIDYIYSVESLYGGRQGLLDFVKEAHKRGIGVMLDVVYNHMGPNELDLWQFDGWSQDGKGGIYFYQNEFAETPWGPRPDYGRKEVRDYILDNVKMWLTDCHMDGIRVDSTCYMRTTKGHNNEPSNDIPQGWAMIQMITDTVRQTKPKALVVAEDFSENQHITKPTSDGGAGFMAQWAIYMPYVLRHVLDSPDDHQRKIDELVWALNNSHNNTRYNQVIFSDSHDSAGNGAKRINEEISPGHPDDLYARKRTLMASGAIMTMPGIPMMLQGEEMMENGYFNDWQALDWSKADRFKGIIEAHKHLIALRKNQYGHTAGLSGESVKVLHQHNDNCMLAYHRWQNGGEGDDVIIIMNFANDTKTGYELPFPRDGKWIVRFNSDWKGYSDDFGDTKSTDVDAKDGKGKVTVGPYSVLVLSQGE